MGGKKEKKEEKEEKTCSVAATCVRVDGVEQVWLISDVFINSCR